MAREVKAMTRREIMTKAINGQLSWLAAADIIGVTARHMRRIRRALRTRRDIGGDGPARRTPAAQAHRAANRA